MPYTEIHIDLEKIKRIADILKTIGHPVRLQVLEVLSGKEPMSVSEIQENLDEDIEQSLLSHHLIKMKDRGILSCEKQGMNVLYRLEDRNILKIFKCMESCNILDKR